MKIKIISCYWTRKKGPIPKLTIYKHDSDKNKNKKCHLSVGNFGFCLLSKKNITKIDSICVW